MIFSHFWKIWTRLDQTFWVAKKNETKHPEVRPWDRHVKHVCKMLGSTCIIKNGVDVWIFERNI